MGVENNDVESTDEGKEAKPTINEVLASLVKRNKALGQGLSEESELRSLGDRRSDESVEDLRSEVNNLRVGLFLMYSCYLDLMAPARGSSDPAVVEDAGYHTNLAMGQQAAISPQMYEASYGFDAQTGELLPGRTPGVPVQLPQE